MKLAAVSDLLDRIGFDEIDTVVQLAGESLDAVSSELEAMLRQETFLKGSYTERFRVRTMREFAIGREVLLNLSNGFLTADAVTVSTAVTGQILSTSFTALDEGYIQINRDKGQITIQDKDISHKVVQVEYTAGFENVDGTPDQYDDVPPWLVSAAISYAIIRMDQINPTLRHDDEKQAQLSIERMGRELEVALGPYIRYFADGLYPENG